jgi:hypothetical protein
MRCFVNGPGVVCAIRRDGCYLIVDLFEQHGHPRTVSCPSASQIRGDDLTRTGINSEVQLPPSSVLGRFSQMADVNPQTRAIDEQMDRSIVPGCTKGNLAELPETPG